MKSHVIPDTDSPRGASPSRVARTDAARLRYLNLYRVYHRTLGPDERAALHLVEVHHGSYAEVAEAMRCSTEAVRRLVFTARRQLFTGMAPTLKSLII